jgi:hypothetical protein
VACCTTPERRRLPSYLPTTTHHSPSSSSGQRSVVHSGCSGAVFFTVPSRLPAAILPLHYTQASLAGCRSSPPGRPWPLATPCFKCFQGFRNMFSFVSFRYCLRCNDYIHMLLVFQLFQTYVSVLSGCCITCMLQACASSVSHVCCNCFNWML